MTVETLEETHRAQEQIEDLARLARNVKVVVAHFEGAYRRLQDSPEALLENLCRLTAAADAVAAIAAEWAQVSNADFNPSDTATFVVIGDIDQQAYGPFVTREKAAEFAEMCDGAIFVCTNDGGEGSCHD
jgi:hypothetical protein